MKLKRVQTYVAGKLHTAPTAFTAYGCHTIDQTIDLWPLVGQILEQFLDTDRGFKAQRRRTQDGPGAGPTAS
jgi:hypothetical protein